MTSLTVHQVPLLLRQAESLTLDDILRNYTIRQIEDHICGLHYIALCWENWPLVQQLEKCASLRSGDKTENYRSALEDMGDRLASKSRQIYLACSLLIG